MAYVTLVPSTTTSVPGTRVLIHTLGQFEEHSYPVFGRNSRDALRCMLRIEECAERGGRST